jgi:hypothetical protein
MSNEEFEALPEEVRNKLLMLQAADNGLAALDLIGATALAKAPMTVATKNAVKEAVTKGAISAETKALAKQALKAQGKQAIVGGTIAAGVGTGGEAWLTGKVTPGQAVHSFVTGAGLGVATPAGGEKTAIRSRFKRTKTGEPTKIPLLDEPTSQALGPEEMSVGIKYAADANQAHVDAQFAAADLEAGLGNPDVAPVDYEQPSYQIAKPETVGQADALYKLGVDNLDQGVLDADARIKANTPEVPDAVPGEPNLDIPTFIRNNPEQALSDAIATGSRSQAEIDAIRNRHDNPAYWSLTDQNPVWNGTFNNDVTSVLPVARREDFEMQLKNALIEQQRNQTIIDQAQEALGLKRVVGSGTVTDDVTGGFAEATPPPVTPSTAYAPTPVAASNTPPTAPLVAAAGGDGNPPTDWEALRALLAQEDQRKADLEALYNGTYPGNNGAPDGTGSPTPPPGGGPGNVPPVQGDDLKAPRQAEILLGGVAAAEDREAIRAILPKKSKASLEQLEMAGAKRIADVTDDTILAQQYANEPYLDGPEDLYAALHAADRLSGKTDPLSKAAIANIFSAITSFSSDSALNLRASQILWDQMTPEMKTATAIKKIQKLRAQRYGNDDPRVEISLEDQAVIESQFNQLFQQDQALKNAIAEQDAILAAADPNDPLYNPNVTREQLEAAGAAKTDLEDAILQNNDKFGGIFSNLIPGPGKLDRLADFQRSAMLSSLLGRVSDVFTTGHNVGRTAIEQGAEGVLGRAANYVGGTPGKYIDRGMSGTELVKAIPGALTKAKGELQGSYDVGDISQFITGKGPKTVSDLGPSRGGLFKRATRAGTNLATHGTEGVAKSELGRLARQEGLQQGIQGDALDNFIISRKFKPTRHATAKAVAAKEAINNLNMNPVTNLMRQFGNSMETNFGSAGKFVKNAIIAFPTWVGGNIYNSVTDRNVVANMIKIATEAKKGNPQGVIRNVAKSGLGTAELFGLGYGLTELGILSSTDAEGKDYEGVYFHIGDKYIPVTNVGAFAPNIILGNALHRSLNDENNSEDNILENIGETAVTSLSSAYKALSGEQVFGGGSWIAREANDTLQSKEASLGRLAGIPLSSAGQFIPAITNDINSVLDQIPLLNKTGEKAQTNVYDEDTGKKDYGQSNLRKFANRIPGVSQLLDREEGVAAKSPVDRILRSNNDTPTGKLEKKQAQSKADRQKANKEAGIPDWEVDGWEEAVKAREEDGEYDQAIESYKQKLAAAYDNDDIADSTREDLEYKIRRNEVMRDNKYKYADFKQYDEMDLEDWRKLGNPDDENYSKETQALYDKLWNIDQAFTKANASDGSDGHDKAKFYLTAKKGGSGGGGGGANYSLRTTPLEKVTLGNLRAENVSSPKIQKIAKVRPNQVMKRRTISVRKGA